MLKDITIGQYIPGNSPLHRMNPPIKIILTVFYMAVLFIIRGFVPYAMFTVYLTALIIVSGVGIKLILKGIKPVLWIILFTAVINIIMTPGEAVFSVPLRWFSLHVTREGLVMAAMITVRLVYLISGASLLTLTTSPLQLTDGIEKMLSPFKRFKVPSHEIAMMMTIAIRFIPTLAEETDKIMKAQTARGADFKNGNILRRAKAMLPILVPLFVSAFRRADELATAMEARCYRGGEGRTRMKESRVTRLDFVAVVIFAAAAASLITANILW